MKLRKTKINRWTLGKLTSLILDFLTIHEASMASDYRPEDEQWKQALACELARYILNKEARTWE